MLKCGLKLKLSEIISDSFPLTFSFRNSVICSHLFCLKLDVDPFVTHWNYNEATSLRINVFDQHVSSISKNSVCFTSLCIKYNPCSNQYTKGVIF